MKRLAIRGAMSSVHIALSGWWFLTRPRTHGVHGIPVTPGGKVVLVRITYGKGWQLPGGGRKAAEDDRTAMLRELQEEIGLTAYDSLDAVTHFEHRPNWRRDSVTVFRIGGVRYDPPSSLEIEAIETFALDRLPPDLSPRTRMLIEQFAE